MGLLSENTRVLDPHEVKICPTLVSISANSCCITIYTFLLRYCAGWTVQYYVSFVLATFKYNRFARGQWYECIRHYGMILKSHKCDCLWIFGAQAGNRIWIVALTSLIGDINMKHRKTQSVMVVKAFVDCPMKAHCFLVDIGQSSEDISAYTVANFSHWIPTPEIKTLNGAVVFRRKSTEVWKQLRPSANSCKHVDVLRSARAFLVSWRKASWYGVIEGGTVQYAMSAA